MAPRVKWAGKAIQALSLHKPKLPMQRIDFFLFAILGAFVFSWCFQTAGEPLAQALAKIEADDEAEAEGETTVMFGDNVTDSLVQNVIDLAAETTGMYFSFNWFGVPLLSLYSQR